MDMVSEDGATLADVVRELREMQKLLGARQERREKPPINWDSPWWSVRHIAALLDCSTGNVENHVVTAPDFPACRRPKIGANGKREMRRRWSKAEVLAWVEAQEPETRAAS